MKKQKGASIQFDMLFKNLTNYLLTIYFSGVSRQNDLKKSDCENGRKQFSPKDNPVLELNL